MAVFDAKQIDLLNCSAKYKNIHAHKHKHRKIVDSGDKGYLKLKPAV